MTNVPKPDPADRRKYWEATAEALGKATREVAERPELSDHKEKLGRHAEAIELVLRNSWQEIEELAAGGPDTLCSFCGQSGRLVFSSSVTPSSPTDPTPEPWICEDCLELLHYALSRHRQREKPGQRGTGPDGDPA